MNVRNRALSAALYDWHNSACLRDQRADVSYYMQQASNSSPSRIMVIGCGTGRVSGPLSAAGWSVTGVDVDLARLARAKRHDSRARVVQADARNFRTRRPFDLIILPYSTAQLFAAGHVLQDLGATLRACSSGTILIDVSDHFAGRRDIDQWRLVATGYCEEVGQQVTEWQRIVVAADHCQIFIRFCTEGLADVEIEEVWHFHPHDLLCSAMNEAGLDLVRVDRGYGAGIGQHRRIYHFVRR
jgi:SAM-dependent methyltransferase